MSKPAIQDVERVFHQLLALPASQRADALDTACGGDTDLRVTVEEMLRHADDETDSCKGEDADNRLPHQHAGAVAQQPATQAIEDIRRRAVSFRVATVSLLCNKVGRLLHLVNCRVKPNLSLTLRACKALNA